MKTIGFIDYYLNEWHANNYPDWIGKGSKNSGVYKTAYAWGERESPDGVSSKAWCDKNNVTLCSSIEEVCEKSDSLIILSPDNSEKHLEYAQKVLPYKKTVYIDKTLTPNLADAKEIFRFAEKYQTPVCSSSALRFASEIASFDGDALSITTGGGGPSFNTYAVHQFEMIVKVMGTGAEKMMAFGNSLNKSIVIVFKDGRQALYNQFINSDAPFTVSIEQKGSTNAYYKNIDSAFFQNFIDSLLVYFDTRIPLAKKEETLTIMALIEGGEKALKEPFKWIPVECR